MFTLTCRERNVKASVKEYLQSCMGLIGLNQENTDDLKQILLTADDSLTPEPQSSIFKQVVKIHDFTPKTLTLATMAALHTGYIAYMGHFMMTKINKMLAS